MAPTVWFTSDEHFGHRKILEYSGRPFATVEEMDAEIIRRHNEVVGPNDIVVHLGDFTLRRGFQAAAGYFDQLAGREHLFIPGSHDRWMDEMRGVGGWPLPFYLPEGAVRDPKRRASFLPALAQIKVGKQEIVCCHYAMRVWAKSHYGSIHLYGHSHGRLPGLGRSFDVGVDGHNFYPWSFEQVLERVEGIRAHNEARRGA